MSAKTSFFAELQRRHVYKVGAMYCVGGWLLVQIVTQVLPVFDVSALGQRILVLIVVAGFPVALVLAWLFDLTPQGIVRTAEAPAAGESPAAVHERQGVERRLNYVLGALLLLGIVYVAFLARRQGRWQQSIELFDQALALDPRNIEYLCQAGLTAAGLRDFPLAMRYFERCQDVAPQLASTLSNKAWLHQAQGQLDAAEPLLAGIDPDPSDVPTILTVASQKLFRRRYPEGIALLQACLDHLDASRRRERAFLEFHLGEFQRLSGQAAAARTTYRHAQDDAAAVLTGQPGNGDLLNLQALVHLRLGETTAAMDYSRQALQAVPAGGDALSLAAAKDTLARVLAGSGNPGAAIDILEHLLAGPSLSDSEFEPLLTAATLRLDPEWDGLRRDPRFQRLAGGT